MLQHFILKERFLLFILSKLNVGKRWRFVSHYLTLELWVSEHFRNISLKLSSLTKENCNCPNSLLFMERQQLEFHHALFIPSFTEQAAKTSLADAAWPMCLKLFFPWALNIVLQPCARTSEKLHSQLQTCWTIWSFGLESLWRLYTKICLFTIICFRLYAV